ncbi:MAG: UDP-N-acetylglucosamine 2-epimerase [Phycisphaerales bacterium]
MTARRRILGVTGSRAEFGLLEPVFRAISERSELELCVAVAGAHLLPPGHTAAEVRRAFPVVAEVAMQTAGTSTRMSDAIAFGRGALGFAQTIDALRPDAVLVLGDRIEAFAAASAAAIAGVRVAHMHGGDRAEGVADESMRHAISKLAHLHLPATEASAERLRRMGEDDDRIAVVGSPAIDGLDDMPAIDDATFDRLGRPEILVLLHPTGRDDEVEALCAAALYAACIAAGRTLALRPNADPGAGGVLRALADSGLRTEAHLPRRDFVGLLRRVRLLAGNSSAGLIEAAALRTRVLNVGSRQAGRERAANVVDVPGWDREALGFAVRRALEMPSPPPNHPYGDGRAGVRTAELLAGDALGRVTIAKRNRY